jgi:hypothetical protein
MHKNRCVCNTEENLSNIQDNCFKLSSSFHKLEKKIINKLPK